MQKEIILDYSTCEAHVFSYNKETDGEIEQYLEELSSQGLIGRIGDCEWMCSENLQIKVH